MLSIYDFIFIIIYTIVIFKVTFYLKKRSDKK